MARDPNANENAPKTQVFESYDGGYYYVSGDPSRTIHIKEGAVPNTWSEYSGSIPVPVKVVNEGGFYYRIKEIADKVKIPWLTIGIASLVTYLIWKSRR